MRQIKFFEALFPIVFLILSLYLSLEIYNVNINYALFFSLLVGAGVALKLGVSFKVLFSMIWQGIKPTFGIVLMFLLIGILISNWHLSGTIPAMIYYGIQIVQPQTFYLSCFIICGLVSLLLGTSIGTISTVGIAFMGIAHSLGLSMAISAGAIISGAFIGDRSSPLSTSAILTAAVTETNLYRNLRYMLHTIALPFLATCILFFVLGHSIDKVVTLSQLPIITALFSFFNLNPLVLLPPFFVLTLAIFHIKTRNILTIGIILGMIVAIFFQHASIINIIQVSIWGYENPHQPETLSKVIRGGGVFSFIENDIVILISSALAGILDQIGALKLLLNHFLKSVRSLPTLNIFAMISSIFVAIVTANQATAIILPSKILLPLYRQFKATPSDLARSISDSGVMVVSLIPWNVNALLCTSILSVSTFSYWPYNFLCWLTPLTSMLFYLICAIHPKSHHLKLHPFNHA